MPSNSNVPLPARGLWYFPVAIVLAACCAYADSFRGCFLLDDAQSIVHNPRIRLFPPAGLALGERALVDYSLALNYALGGLDVTGYHAVNLAIHLLAALALYGLLRQTFAPDLHAAALAFAVASLWVVHPLTTQAVTYLVQRAEALMALFYLLTLYALARGAAAPRRGPRLAWYAAAIACCVLGTSSKQVMVSAPIAALLYERVFLAPSWADVLRRRGLVHLGLAASWLLLVPTVQLVVGEPGSSVGFAVAKVTWWEYLVSQPGVLLHYLGLVFWPYPLCFDYAWPVARTPLAIVGPGLAILSLLALTGWALWRRPRLGFWAAWALLVLAPTSSVIPILDLAVEHRMYLPLAGVLVLVVLGARQAMALLAHRVGWDDTQRRARSRLVLGLATALLAALTFLRNADYQSPLSMWNRVVELRPDNTRAHVNLGFEYARAGQPDAAERHYRTALAQMPELYGVRIGLVLILLDRGAREEAEGHLRQALESPAATPAGHARLGQALLDYGRPAEAIPYFQRALCLDPTAAGVRAFLDRALELTQTKGAARSH